MRLRLSLEMPCLVIGKELQGLYFFRTRQGWGFLLPIRRCEHGYSTVWGRSSTQPLIREMACEPQGISPQHTSCKWTKLTLINYLPSPVVKTNLVGFISEPDVGAGTNRKWTKCQSKSQSKVFIKDLRPSNCSSRLVTNAFPVGEWWRKRFDFLSRHERGLCCSLWAADDC